MGLKTWVAKKLIPYVVVTGAAPVKTEGNEYVECAECQCVMIATTRQHDGRWVCFNCKKSGAMGGK